MPLLRSPLFDFILAAIILVLTSPLIAVTLVIGKVIFGKAIFTQCRVGAGGAEFRIYKLRTLPIGTPNLPTHQLPNIRSSHYGSVLRMLKIDELPQLINVMMGTMRIVGPRPCLPQQLRLIKLRSRRGLLALTPGITGYAQINNINMSNELKLVAAEAVTCGNITARVTLCYVVWTVGSIVRRCSRSILNIMKKALDKIR